MFAALLIHSERSKFEFTCTQILWRRQIFPCASVLLPRGFVQHQDMITNEVLDCIQDIAELQHTVQMMKQSSIDRMELSNMQASIESRLASQEASCEALGPVAECCRIAALITCFISFIETWSNPLVPCRLSDMLRVRLHESISDTAWLERRNLQLWLFLTGSYVTVLNSGFVDDLPQKWSALLAVLGIELVQSHYNATNMRSALDDFVYCNNLLQRRFEVTAWLDLELHLCAA